MRSEVIRPTSRVVIFCSCDLIRNLVPVLTLDTFIALTEVEIAAPMFHAHAPRDGDHVVLCIIAGYSGIAPVMPDHDLHYVQVVGRGHGCDVNQLSSKPQLKLVDFSNFVKTSFADSNLNPNIA